jgi:hypothetical protein
MLQEIKTDERAVMPLYNHFDPDLRVVYAQYTGHVTLEDVTTGIQLTAEIVEAYPHIPFHNIVDMREMTSYPTNVFQVMDTVRKTYKHRITGWVLIVSERNQVIQFIISVVGQTFNFRFRFFNQLEEAVAFLREQDPNLLPLEDWLAQHSVENLPPV